MYNFFTFLVFLAAVSGLLFFGLRRGGFAEYPFLFCAVYLGWLFPQLLALQSDAELSSIYDRVPIVALMVLLAVMIGWRSPRVTPTVMDDLHKVDGSRLLVGVTVLTAAGLSTQVLLVEMSKDIVVASLALSRLWRCCPTPHMWRWHFHILFI